MIDVTELQAHFSSRRPKAQAWRVESDGYVSYAETEEEAILLHRSKIEVRGRIDELLIKCAAVN